MDRIERMMEGIRILGSNGKTTIVAYYRNWEIGHIDVLPVGEEKAKGIALQRWLLAKDLQNEPAPETPAPDIDF